MKKTFRTVALILAAVLTIGMLAFPAAASGTADEEKWVDNVLIEEPLQAFQIDLKHIRSVTFLDSTADAPENPWYMGAKYYTNNVLAWVQWDGYYAHVFFAADGGINAEECAEGLFRDCVNLTEVNFNGALRTDRCESLRDMFRDCASIPAIDVSGLNTGNCESMREMFRGCLKLEKVDLTGLDTSKVESMYAMFSTCPELKEVDVTGFDTSSVTNLGFMFSLCRKLEKVDVSGFDTSKVNYMEGTFRWCDSLESVDVSGWDVSRVQIWSDFMDPGMEIGGKPWPEFFRGA